MALLWIAGFGSRPVSSWLSVNAGAGSAEAYLEGNWLERTISLVLIAGAIVVLSRRRTVLKGFARQNTWLFVFVGYCLLSVLWSDYPFVAFKRWFRDFGNVLIVLVLLTEINSVEAVKTVFVRCAYLLVPLSFLFVRYFPEIGRQYTGWNSNSMMVVGVATHKNTLGALLLVSVGFLGWDLIRWRQGEQSPEWFGWFDRAAVIGMATWLLMVADSATSLVCTVLFFGVYLITGRKVVLRRARLTEFYLLLGVCLWVALDGVFNVYETLIMSLGRDTTLTTRTDLWPVVVAQVENPLIGAGFKSFWAGERMIRLWVERGGIVQAHSGYVETYLNGGYLGLLFLGIMMLAGLQNIKRGLLAGSEFARVRFAFWVVAIFYNYSEAGFNQPSLVWVVTLISVMEMPALVQMHEVAVGTARRFSGARFELRPALFGKLGGSGTR
jgi:hypothetical protein